MHFVKTRTPKTRKKKTKKKEYEKKERISVPRTGTIPKRLYRPRPLPLPPGHYGGTVIVSM